MHISFEKYHGAGNDFIMIDNRNSIFDGQNFQLIKHLCNRHFGIGADGLILIEKSVDMAFKMNYYNADGNPGSMCGNGGRCAVAFANKLRIMNQNADVVFDAADGRHKASIISAEYLGSAVVKLSMNDVDKAEANDDYFFINTGSPHYIKFVDDVNAIDVINEGKAIRYTNRFKTEGTNVNFAQTDGETIKVRTYERGVEDETLACGTGVTAVALAAAIQSKFIGEHTQNILATGGNLKVSYKYDGYRFSKIFLEGDATFVFTGIIEI